MSVQFLHRSLGCRQTVRRVTAILIGALVALLVMGNDPRQPLQAQELSGITSPAPSASISGDVPILGTAVIEPFQKYELHYKQEPSGDDAFIYFSGSTSPVVNGQLGVWQAGGLPPGTYTIRLRVVKADGNYAEFFAPNLSVNQAPAVPTPTATPGESPTPTPTFTPAAQPTPSLGQVTQPQVQESLSATGEATPAPLSAVDVGQGTPAESGLLLPTATPLPGASTVSGQPVPEESLTRSLGESLSFSRLRTQFFNGMRISAALLIGAAALLFGKRLFGWVWRRFG